MGGKETTKKENVYAVKCIVFVKVCLRGEIKIPNVFIVCTKCAFTLRLRQMLWFGATFRIYIAELFEIRLVFVRLVARASGKWRPSSRRRGGPDADHKSNGCREIQDKKLCTYKTIILTEIIFKFSLMNI